MKLSMDKNGIIGCSLSQTSIYKQFKVYLKNNFIGSDSKNINTTQPNANNVWI